MAIKYISRTFIVFYLLASFTEQLHFDILPKSCIIISTYWEKCAYSKYIMIKRERIKMNKAPWILLVPLCILYTSHQAHSEKHSYPATPGMDLEGCKDSCKKSQQEYFDFYETLNSNGSGKVILTCECIDKEKPAE